MAQHPKLIEFLKTSLTAYHAEKNVKALLLEKGFTLLNEQEEWQIEEGGNYFVERGASLIAFKVGSLDNFCFKITASHLDSPALKIKENPVKKCENCLTLNTETYGGGIWYSFFDRPLKIAGRVIFEKDDTLYPEVVESPFIVHIPSLSAHMNRDVNSAFSVNAQTDLAPLISLSAEQTNWLEQTVQNKALAYDLYLTPCQEPYFFGVNNEFLASPRIDNLISVYATVEGLLNAKPQSGICVGAFMQYEETGNRTAQGASGDFLKNTLRLIAYALKLDVNDFYKAIASSFLLSVDNAHAVHPNHPEKSDPTNKTLLGKGVVIKSHANGAYVTDALSSAVVKRIFEKAGVPYQYFFNRADMPSGSTLGVAITTRLGMNGADIGIAQLAMHSAMECCCILDYAPLVDGITAFYSMDITGDGNSFTVK